ncbi:hypothetical protein C8J56DRAFT_190997 [Mycena floridula]|nr:hypothetical protein C8J56DRAFT_190997 [Mycena floridula]
MALSGPSGSLDLNNHGSLDLTNRGSLDVNDPLDMKHHLQVLLSNKEKELQQAGALGQQVLQQHQTLEAHVRELQEVIDGGGLGSGYGEAGYGGTKGYGDAGGLGYGDRETQGYGETQDYARQEEAKERFKELQQTMSEWDEENRALSGAFGAGVKDWDVVAETDAAKASVSTGASASSTGAKPASTAAQSRRAKNAAHRADDVEFAFEIGSGLLNEVRRLQSLLGERDKAIQDMKEEKDDLEASVEGLRTALKAMESNADKYKEENWNLEVSMQELRSTHTDLVASHTKQTTDLKILSKQLSSALASSEHLTTTVSTLETSLAEVKGKAETDMANARKHAASLARDKSDLQQSVDTLKADLVKTSRRFPKFGSPLTPGGGGGDSNSLAPGSAHPQEFLTPGIGEHDVFSNPGTASRRRGQETLFEEFESDEDVAEDGSPVKRTTLAGLAPGHPDNEIEVLRQRLAHSQRQIGTLKNALLRERRVKGRQAKNLDDDDEEDGLNLTERLQRAALEEEEEEEEARRTTEELGWPTRRPCCGAGGFGRYVYHFGRYVSQWRRHFSHFGRYVSHWRRNVSHRRHDDNTSSNPNSSSRRRNRVSDRSTASSRRYGYSASSSVGRYGYSASPFVGRYGHSASCSC